MMKCARCYLNIKSGEYVEGTLYCDFRNVRKGELSCAERVRRATVPIQFLKTSSRNGRRDITSHNNL